MKIERDFQIEKIASLDDSRYVLTHLHIHRAHPVLKCDALEATDGRRYVAVPVELSKEDKGDFVPADLFVELRKLSYKFSGVRNGVLEIIIGTSTIDLPGVATFKGKFGKDVGKYPDVNVIMPRLNNAAEKTPIEDISLNAMYLFDMQRAMAANGLTMTSYGLTGIEVEPHSGCCYGVLMPMRKT